VGVYFCGGFIYIAVDVSPVGDYEKLIILAIIAGVISIPAAPESLLTVDC